MKRGKLYGISVGPGDPSLITLKAVECIKQCPVLAAPRTNNGNSLALKIASQATNLTSKTIEYLDLQMTRDRNKRNLGYEAAAKQLMTYLDKGQNVGVLTLGDASLYSSYSYLLDIFKEWDYEVETIPGVTSYSACAALLNYKLTEMDMPLHILPASMKDLPAALALVGSKVIMKSGQALEDIKNLIYNEGLENHAVIVSDCGLESQQVITNIEEAGEESYFSTILIKSK